MPGRWCPTWPAACNPTTSISCGWPTSPTSVCSSSSPIWRSFSMPSAVASIGWAMADHLQASLAIDALKMAIKRRKPAPGSLIHHSDRGIQYACSDYTELLAAHHITPSMSRIGNPYDNAKAERFMRTLKTEQIDGTLYRHWRQAERAIGDFIDRIYNVQRLHTALDYRSPAQFEACHRARALPGVGDAALERGSATPTPNLPLDPKTPRAQAMT